MKTKALAALTCLISTVALNTTMASAGENDAEGGAETKGKGADVWIEGIEENPTVFL